MKLRAADALMAAIPRRVPSRTALENCRIIAHRGEHDNVRTLENTLPAFERARAAGVWGIECDIRWTADGVPVICHDPTAERVFGHPAVIGELPFSRLRAELPLIPSLAELVAALGGRSHLMLELKAEPFPDPAGQRQTLARTLSALTPGRDYHLLALDPALFELADCLDRRHCIAVAEENVDALCSACLAAGHDLAGHFLLLGGRVQRRLTGAGLRMGTGFVASRNCLFRELNRGVEWIFSNDAVRLQTIRDHYLARR